MIRPFLVCLAAMLFLLGRSADFETGSFSPAQTVADIMRAESSADIGFVAAGLLRSDYDEATDPLVSLLQFPTDEVAVVELTGNQILDALERSVSLYPTANPRFLQVSGLRVTFDPALPEVRVVNVEVNGDPLSTSEVYEVAMPMSLAIGGLGYFRVWERDSVVRTLGERNLERILAGQRAQTTEARWIEQGS